MTTMRVPSASTRSGGFQREGSRRRPFAARRRLLLVGCLLMLVVVAVAANYGPVRHYRDARARLDKAAGEVAALEEQRVALQSQLRKLISAGYLEGLAREELTYARPDEDVYIVTGLPDEAGISGGASTGTIGTEGTLDTLAAFAARPAAGLGIGAAAFFTGTGDAGSDAADRPGLLERLLLAIASIF